MRQLRISIVVFVVFLFNSAFAVANSPAANSPAETISKVVEEVRATVKEKQEKLSNDALDAELRKLISPVFDWRTMARSCLAKHWKEATKEQQNEFVDLFSDLLATTYLKKIRENVATTDFKLNGEKIKGKKAIVKTSVMVDDDDAAIDYRMRLKDSSWQVYDVIIENIGLVSNYRSEFAGIVKNEKIEGLLVKLREKTKSNPKQVAASK